MKKIELFINTHHSYLNTITKFSRIEYPNPIKFTPFNEFHHTALGQLL